jgi:hypothetical protein
LKNEETALGISLKYGVKRLAVHVKDHLLNYGNLKVAILEDTCAAEK